MRIRIVSPASALNPLLIDGAAQRLSSWGHEVSIAPHAKDRFGQFAGTTNARKQDLMEALADPMVDAILCARGGYGVMQLIDDELMKALNQGKLILGFSDITCLHNMLAQQNIPSVHSIMAKHIATLPDDSEPIVTLRNILNGGNVNYSFPTDSNSRRGKAKGILRGGNLAVLLGMQGTPYQLKTENGILFLEDVGEAHYRVERMLQNLRLAGVFEQVKGVIYGNFTGTDNDPRMNQTVQEMLLSYTENYSYPVICNFSAGHIDNNLPLILNTETEIDIQEQTTSITQKR